MVEMRRCVTPFRYRSTLTVFGLILVLLLAPATHAQAPQEVARLPPLAPFTTARYSQVTEIIGEQRTTWYEQGAVVLPDRYTLWRDDSATDAPVDEIEVRIGSTRYQFVDEAWEQDDIPGSTPSPASPAQLLIHYLPQIEARAFKIVRMDTQELGGTPTAHYQLWVEDLAFIKIFTSNIPDDITVTDDPPTPYKFDVWLDETGTVRQFGVVDRTAAIETSVEGSTITLPETIISELTTFSDIDDPSITIEPPIPAPEE